MFFSSLLLAQTVYVTRTGAKYHKDGCRYLRQSQIEMQLKDAIAEGYAACKVCKPPTAIKSSSSENQSSTSSSNTTEVKKQSSEPKSYSTSGRCQATTKKGTQCKRKAAAGSNYCWQHGG